MGRAIFIAYLCMVLFGFADNVRGPLYPELIAHFGLTNAVGAWFFAASSVASIAGAIFARRAIAVRGYRWAFLAFLGAVALGLAGVAAAPVFPGVLAAAAVLGVGFGGLGVSQNAIVSSAASEHQILRFQSGLHSLYGLSSLLAPLFAAFVFSFLPHWRVPFALLAGATFLLWVQVFRGEELARPPATAVTPRDPARREQLPEIFFWAFTLSLYVAVEILVTSRLVQYLRETQFFDFTRASVGLSVFFLSLFASRALFIFLPVEGSLLARMLACLSATALLLVLGLSKFTAAWGGAWLLSLAGFTMGPFYPMTMTWLSRRFKADLEVTVAACLAFSGAVVVLMHGSVGFLTDRFGIAATFWLGPVLLLVAITLVLGYRLRHL